MWSCYFIEIFIEIIIELTERSWFPLTILSCKIQYKYHNQDIDIDSIQRPHSGFPSFTCMHLWIHTDLCVCAHLILYNVIMGSSCIHHHSQDRTVSSPQQLLMLPFYNHTKLPPSFYLRLIPTNHKHVTHLYKFIISKHLNKWNYTVYNLLGLAFFTWLTGDYLDC